MFIYYLRKSITGFHANKKIGIFCLIILPLILGAIFTYLLRNVIIDNDIVLTISSIFIGFYLSILIAINGKIFSINANLVRNIEEQGQLRRYLKYSNKYACMIYYGLISIIVMVISMIAVGLNIDITVNYIFLFAFYFSANGFAISLLRNIYVLLDFFHKDYSEKYNQNESIKFE